MPFIPHTEEDIQEMLAATGVDSIDALFSDISENLQIDKLNLPEGLSEAEAASKLKKLAAQNRPVSEYSSYLGGGAYEHFIPAAVDALALRGEFATAYTPYQAEASQGTLQAIYEFQSMLCTITGLEVANASMYDGGTAVAEAALMALRLKPKASKIIVPATLPNRISAVIDNYLEHTHGEIVRLTDAADTSQIQIDALESLLDGVDEGALAAMVIPVTNALGGCEPCAEISKLVKEKGGVVIAYTNPLSLSILQPPGSWGADICVGEAQPLGIPLSWGGPYCGYLTTLEKHVRRMPGRLVGCSVDTEGRRAFTLTLQTREQHIRRDKATSNICTNQGLMALRVTVFLSLIGKEGFRRLGLLNHQRARALRDKLLALDGIEAVTADGFFNEFTISLPKSSATVIEAMRAEHKILAGIQPEVDNAPHNWLTICATETKTEEDLGAYIDAMSTVLA